MKRLVSFKFGGSSKNAATTSKHVASEAEELASKVAAALSSLDRASNAVQRRRRAAELAKVLNSVAGDASVLVLEVLQRDNAAQRLLRALDGALNDSDDESDDSQDVHDDDIVLATSLLSCLASIAFIGGVLEIQAAGGVLQLLRLMKYDADDGTMRSYAAACMQNATSFLELFSYRDMSDAEHAELKRVIDCGDERISGPARHVQTNVEQARHFQQGDYDVARLSSQLAAARERSNTGQAAAPPIVASGGSDERWWERTTSISELVGDEVEKQMQPMELRLELRMGSAGFGVRLAAFDASKKPRSKWSKPAAALRLKAALKAAKPAPAPAPAPAPLSARGSSVPPSTSGGGGTDSVPPTRPVTAEGGTPGGAPAPAPASAAGGEGAGEEGGEGAGEGATGGAPATEDTAPGVGAAPAAAAPASASRPGSKAGGSQGASPPRSDAGSRASKARGATADEEAAASVKGSSRHGEEGGEEGGGAAAAANVEEGGGEDADAPPPPPPSVVVTRVAAESPNASLILVGDQLVSVGGEAVHGNYERAVELFRDHAASSPNEPLSVTVVRLVDMVAVRAEEAAQVQAEETRLREADEAMHPWRPMVEQLEELTKDILRVVDPEEVARMELREATSEALALQQMQADADADADEAAALLLEPTPDGERRLPVPPTEAALHPPPPRTAGSATAAPVGAPGPGAPASARSGRSEAASGAGRPLSTSGSAYVGPPRTNGSSRSAGGRRGMDSPSKLKRSSEDQFARQAVQLAAERRFGDPVELGGLSLSEQARQLQIDRAWEVALALNVKVVMGSKTVRLTGKQIVGLHAHAERAPSGQVAFANGDGDRIVLSLHALEILKGQLEAKCLGGIAPAAAMPLRGSERGTGGGGGGGGAYGGGGGGEAEAEAEGEGEDALAGSALESLVTFLDAAMLREAITSGALADPRGKVATRLPSYTEIASRFPEWHVERPLHLSDAVSGACVSSLLAVSHRWEQPEGSGGHPDPSGVQFAALAAELERRPEIEIVYYDYACRRGAAEEAAVAAERQAQVEAEAAKAAEAAAAAAAEAEAEGEEGDELRPPRTGGSGASRRSGGSRRSARSARSSKAGSDKGSAALAGSAASAAGPVVDRPTAALLPFLCGSCLVLADAGYSAQFATQSEAWLAMQSATAYAGLVEDPSHERCTIRLLRDEPAFMQTLLVESWRGKQLSRALEDLATAEGVEAEALRLLQDRLTRWDAHLKDQMDGNAGVV